LYYGRTENIGYFLFSGDMFVIVRPEMNLVYRGAVIIDMVKFRPEVS